ncbi:LOB domain-containing protein 27 [Acorus calamus]|uniref:LOB domain-containing protein 27 n=1 Tax=Acorus calamus TaxID=4465 RepID=A0AAV9EH43_ACOCL|nr:LOB domain-containing protein 27 [Acorus calamus]
MTVKGGTSQACAACKYQRRKCSATCPLAPYFPPDNPKQFQNAHKLFGVSNILKILNRIDPSQKSEAMRSIIYESNIRDKYPVYGCLGIIMTLQFQIQQVQYECNLVNNQLEHIRQQQQLHCPMLKLWPLSRFSMIMFCLIRMYKLQVTSTTTKPCGYNICITETP